ncbi:MAG: hypothetical protein P8P30_02355 [Rickettsiales bacterium]|nr:hypothetical protein [Rickettsiales bacterium]
MQTMAPATQEAPFNDFVQVDSGSLEKLTLMIKNKSASYGATLTVFNILMSRTRSVDEVVPISIAELVGVTGLTRKSVSLSINLLEKEGVIKLQRHGRMVSGFILWKI